MLRPLVPDALRAGPFTSQAAAALGVSARALQGSTWRHIFREVWAHVDLPDTRESRFAAVQLILGEEGFVCGLTAAWLHGIDAQDPRSDLIWMGFRTPDDGRRRVRPGCFVREITITDADLVWVGSTPVTTPLRTAFDCIRWLSPVEGLVVADALANQGLITAGALESYTASHRPLRNVRKVDRALPRIEPLAESPMETRVRLLIERSGLPRLTAQHVVLDRRGEFVARLDLAYPERHLAIEYDGTFHWNQRRDDDRRREVLRGLGWRVLVFSAQDYYRTPEALVAAVRRAFAEVDVHDRIGRP